MAASAEVQIFNPIPAQNYSLGRLKSGISYAEVNKESKKLGAKIMPKTAAQDWLAAMQAAASQRLPFVILGTDAIRDDAEAALNFGTIAVEPASMAQKDVEIAFKKVFPGLKGKDMKKVLSTHFREGAIINAANWYVFLNDCFIYGALGAGKDFHVGLKSIKNELLWDDSNNRPRALGRELLMLKFSGYTAYKTKQGYTFVPPTARGGDLIPIERYREAIKEVGSIDPILEFIHSAVSLRFTPSPEPRQ
ncbi:MAG: hypothetical protein JSR57_11840 [Verrucomicrobia bacterium]|nr:hypothetical protein [Verrucomicrobiota bacterium]